MRARSRSVTSLSLSSSSSSGGMFAAEAIASRAHVNHSSIAVPQIRPVTRRLSGQCGALFGEEGAGIAVGEDEDERAHRRVGVLGQGGVGAGANLLGRSP